MTNKLDNFPALIEMEVLRGEKWEVMLSWVCNNRESLFKRMEVIRTMYAVSDRKYRIYVTYQSKVNRYIKKIGDV